MGESNSGAASSPAAWDKYPHCFQLRRGFRDRLRWYQSRRIGARGKLRPAWEMDNFFCSHCCTSDVRLLVRGAFGVYRTDASRQFTCFLRPAFFFLSVGFSP